MAHSALRLPRLADLLKRQWLHPPVMRYVAAALLTIAAVLVRRAIDPWMGSSAAFVTIFPVLAFNAFSLGLGPAALSIMLGVVGVNYLILSPKNAFSLTPLDYAASLTY